MKHFLSILLIILSMSCSKNATHYLETISDGEFVFFKDARKKTVFYKGYIFYKVNNYYTFFIRSINTENNDEVMYQMDVHYNNNDLQNHKIDVLSGNDSKYHRQACVDLLNIISAVNNNYSRISSNYNHEDPWEDYTLYYSLDKTIPLFHLSSIKIKFPNKTKENVPRYMLDKSGVIDIQSIQLFKSIKYSNETKRYTIISKYKLKHDDDLKLNIDGVQVTLDNNWTRHSNNDFPSFWISKESKRDAQLTIEVSPWNKFKEKGFIHLEDFIRRTLIHTPGIYWDSYKVDLKNNIFIVQLILLDDDGRENYIYREYSIINNNLVVINFSAYYDFYANNHKYFEKILKSINYL